MNCRKSRPVMKLKKLIQMSVIDYQTMKLKQSFARFHFKDFVIDVCAVFIFVTV